MTSWQRGAIAASTVMLLVISGQIEAQDIEVAAQINGRKVPAAYYERLRQQPNAFQLQGGWIARAAAAAAAGQAVTDTLPLLVIPGLFSDSPEPHISASEVQQVLFDGPSANGTVSEFYNEVSEGRFGIRGVTLPWTRTSITLDSAVGSEFGLGGDAGTGSYLVELLAATDPALDFGAFDNDGMDGIPNSGDDDGFVDAVAFEFLETSATCGGPGIWPHRWVIAGWAGSAYMTDDVAPDGSPIRVNDYIIQSVASCDGETVQSATTIAHELGHVLGLPDLYDHTRGIEPEDRLWVVGCWSLMAAGSWGCGTSNRDAWVRPTHMGAWEKEQLGWLSEVQVVEGTLEAEIVLEPVIQSGRVLKVPLEFGSSADSNEYLLVEYRKQEGFDLDLPSSGVLIYHVDPKIAGNQPSQASRPWHKVRLAEADGNQGLLRTFAEGGNRGEPGDAWGAIEPGRFSNSTDPSTRLNSGSPTGITFYNISLEGDTARIDLSTIALGIDRLLEQFLGTGASPLTIDEAEYLDARGNGNGNYDVGDLRAYLKR
jgi:M6 family metalloprotease-like protein